MNIKYLKESRKDYNLTQAKMAEALGVSIATYQKIELGTNQPSFQTLSKLRSVFGLDLNKLVE